MCPKKLLGKHSEMTKEEKSAETQICTGDARIFSPALYYLSYLGIKPLKQTPILLKKA